MDQETSFAMIVWYINLDLEELDPSFKWYTCRGGETFRYKTTKRYIIETSMHIWILFERNLITFVHSSCNNSYLFVQLK